MYYVRNPLMAHNVFGPYTVGQCNAGQPCGNRGRSRFEPNVWSETVQSKRVFDYKPRVCTVQVGP